MRSGYESVVAVAHYPGKTTLLFWFSCIKPKHNTVVDSGYYRFLENVPGTSPQLVNVIKKTLIPNIHSCSISTRRERRIGLVCTTLHHQINHSAVSSSCRLPRPWSLFAFTWSIYWKENGFDKICNLLNIIGLLLFCLCHCLNYL